ncbi:hypothetical protein [Rhodospirillum rubrum]|nr:hypothetical protein [Rhodospirillum rubrum]
MPKGQQRSNREIKKPKAKKPTAASQAPVPFLGKSSAPPNNPPKTKN